MATGVLPMEIAVYAVPAVTLLLGILIGYLAQRSGFCSIGGFRDYFLFRHTRILSGYLALIVFSFLGYLLFWILTPAAMEHFFWALTSGPFIPVPGAPAGLGPAAYILLAVIPGFLVGFICVLLGGCPIRQAVMTSEGNIRAAFFLLGMAVASPVFAAFVSGWIVLLMKSLGLGA
ncbi:MAG TPA: YeeE/YedE thiosulfate transporter family protein [Methanolinea sp.]|nr:YeeE/YedE thiosulfate transporter family protein [Methanolinea sp.]